jgi:hypothetical protein
MVMRDIKSVMSATKTAKYQNDDDDKDDVKKDKNFDKSAEKATKGYKDAEMMRAKNKPMLEKAVPKKSH